MLKPGQRVIITWCTRCQSRIENTGGETVTLRKFCDKCLSPERVAVPTWNLSEYDIEILRSLPYPIDPT